ncbi:PQQ-binding-like beta-propeller repeat protein [Streptomyces megasporus]|uniref:outer membrane protein assembly factor BamB family protein n=1 Tax=Streptomyces megasporus TaxID=44060 RepID=UPI0004E20BBD|nr:PQQ-binding-like beta-propeller repeat protein [Streptomyces megasporus]
MPETGGGGRPGGGKGRIVAVVAAVVAVLLMAGGGVWLLAGGDGDTESRKSDGNTGRDESARKHKDRLGMLWEVDPPRVAGSTTGPAEARGTWFVGDTIVRAWFDSVTGYDMNTGKEVWSLDLARRGPGCGAAPTVSDGRTVIQWGGMCEKVMAIDLVQGEKLWTKDLPSKGRGTDEYLETRMAVSGDIAAAAWIGNAIGFDLSTGEVLWKAEDGAECRDTDYVGGERLIAKVECDFGATVALHSVKPDGSKGWEWKAPDGAFVERVISLDPVVVGIKAGEALDMSDIVVLGENGDVRSKINIPEGRYLFHSTGIGLADCCRNIVVDKANDALYLQTNNHQGDDDSVTEIVAFDLSTGKSKWLSEPVEERWAAPLAMQGGKLLGYEQVTHDAPGLITSIDPETGKASAYTRLPENTQEKEFQMVIVNECHLYWRDGMFLVVAYSFKQNEAHNEEGVLAFG